MVKYTYHEDGTVDSSKIFVFGSNLRGAHGAGAAAFAHKEMGAVWGKGFGLSGKSFAIPTKDERIQTMPPEEIEPYVQLFLQFAASSNLKFFVTRIGCGLAGYKDEDIAPMFRGATLNCDFPEEWMEFLEENL